MSILEDAWAVSLRIDGSVDATQTDKIYVMAKVITLAGAPKLCFIGVGEQKERGALGLKNTVMDVIQSNTGEAPRRFLEKTSSLCTDGTNVNSGERKGLWTLLDKEMSSLGLRKFFLKLWCAAHRAELVLKNAGQGMNEICMLLSVLSSIASYFNQSGLRTSDLREIAKNQSGLSLFELIQKLAATAESRDEFRELITILARIAACTPTSADVERCISADNRLKTKLRSSMKVDTENMYLFVHHNMPELQNWNPTKATKLGRKDEKMRRDRKENISVKSRAQPHFKGIYCKEKDCDCEEDDEQAKSNTAENVHSTYFDF